MDTRLLFVLFLPFVMSLVKLHWKSGRYFCLLSFVACVCVVSEKYDWEKRSNKWTRKQTVKDRKKETITNSDDTVQEVTDTDVTRQEDFVLLRNWYEYDETALVTDEYRARHKSVLHKV